MLNITDYPGDRLIAKGSDTGVHVGAFEPAFEGDIPVVDLTIAEPGGLSGGITVTTVRMTLAQARDLAVELLRYVVAP